MGIKHFDVEALEGDPSVSTVALARTLLRQVKRLAIIKARCPELLNTQGLWLVDRTLYALYCDCRDLGLGEEALEVIELVKQQEQGLLRAAPATPA
jgi:hypothetical protein